MHEEADMKILKLGQNMRDFAGIVEKAKTFAWLSANFAETSHLLWICTVVFFMYAATGVSVCSIHTPGQSIIHCFYTAGKTKPDALLPRKFVHKSYLLPCRKTVSFKTKADKPKNAVPANGIKNKTIRRRKMGGV
jgi:hypothetical protein